MATILTWKPTLAGLAEERKLVHNPVPSICACLSDWARVAVAVETGATFQMLIVVQFDMTTGEIAGVASVFEF